MQFCLRAGARNIGDSRSRVCQWHCRCAKSDGGYEDFAFVAAAGATLLRHGQLDSVCTARLFCVGDCARLSAAWALCFCLLTIMVVVAAAAQASSRRWLKVWRVQGRVRDPEAHWLCAEGRHMALGEGEVIRTLRERR